MRIGVDIRPLCVPTFGIGRYTRAILDRLVLEPGIDWFFYADRPVLHGYSAHQNVTERSFDDWSRSRSLFRSQVAFSRWASQDRINLFWSPRHHLPMFLPASVKTVVTIHDLVWRLFPETMNRSNLWLERVLMPVSVGRADHLICVSESTTRDLGEFMPGVTAKVSVVPEAAEKLPGIVRDTGAPYFLFVGTLEPRKNLGRLLEAYAIATAKGLKQPLLIAGAQGWKTDLVKLVTQLGLHDRVEILGRVEEEVLHQRLAGATALCLPSLYEGFGLPALEAMMYGTPVIGANVSSIPEVVGDAGVLIDPYSVKAIAEALLLLATDATLRQQLSEAALARSQQFSWDRAASETLGVFRSVLAA